MRIVRSVLPHLAVAGAALLTVVGIAGGCGLLYALTGGIGEGNQTSTPVTYVVEVPREPGDPRPLELRFGPEDSAWLGLTDDPVASPSGQFTVRTSRVDNENTRTYRCLAEPAEVVATAPDVLIATIPAATCLGRAPLVVPTDADPAFAAELDRYRESSGGDPPTELRGELSVNIDGCSTIGGIRVWWPFGTTIDAAGAVVLGDGRTFANGSSITVSARARDVLAGGIEACPSPTGSYVLAVP